MANYKGSGWSTEEDQFIRNNYGKLTAHGCAMRLPGRTRNAVIGRAKRLFVVGDPDKIGRPPNRAGPPRLPLTKKVPNPVGWAPQQRMVTRSAGIGQIKQVPLVAEKPLDVADLKCEPVSLMDRRDDQCCWPLDDGMYCGLLKPKRQPYCPAHQRAQTDNTRKYRRGIWVSPKL